MKALQQVELTERQQAILKAVVEEFVVSATAVPSEKIAGRPGLKVSSATVRNAMVELEELGLLTHPHTSAGRVPSDSGYRYYIERLMSGSPLSSTEQKTVWHQFHQIEAEVDEWGPLAAAVMAQMARMAAVVTKPRARESRVKRVELVSIQEDLALVVLILQSGGVEQRMLRLPEPVERDELMKLAGKLSAGIEGKSAHQVLRKAATLAGLEQEVALLAGRMMEQREHYSGEDLYYEGLGFVSGEPEFGRTDRLVELMEVFHGGSRLAPLFSDVVQSTGLRVVIGSENEAAQMRGYSIVLKRYGIASQSGVVGILGPTRMRYWRAISLVQFMSELLDGLVYQ